MAVTDKTKERVLKTIYNFFIKSRDFNGIGLTDLARNLKIDYPILLPIIEELILENKVSIQDGDNPHIIRFAHYNKDKQLEILKEAANNVEECLDEITIENGPNIKILANSHMLCAYPSITYLKSNRNVDKYNSLPYYKRLALGEPQLSYVFFELDILDKYFNDPRYSFHFRNYSGNIFSASTKTKSAKLEKRDEIFLQSFGLGYGNRHNRVIVVFLRYLCNLTSEHQIYWNTKEVKSKCKIVEDYFNNAILGDWSFSISLFTAFVEEQKIINELSNLIIGVSFFRETYENEKTPKEFTFFTLPTLFNYEKFVSLLDKMISENINRDFFTKFDNLNKFYNGSNEKTEIKQKGTLMLLDSWLDKYYRFKDENGKSKLIEPLKKVRKERQSPAHIITKDYYDEALFTKQMDLLDDVFLSIRSLRYILMKHPSAKDYKVPSWTIDCLIKKF